MSELSGKTGYVKVGSTDYAFGKWKVGIKGGAPKITNWKTGGFQKVVPGVVLGDLTLNGPMDAGSMPLAVNTTYTFHLGMDTGIELAVPAQVTGIDVDNDVEDAPRVSVTATSNGEFTASIA